MVEAGPVKLVFPRSEHGWAQAGDRPEQKANILILRGEKKMSKKSWFKVGLLVASATVAAIPLGNCITQALWQTFFLRAVN